MVSIEETDLYRWVSVLSDAVYFSVAKWPTLAQRTFGEQTIKSIDSVGANLVEGDGRGPGQDAVRFFRIARASCREARNWFPRAKARQILAIELADDWAREATEIAKMINGLIAHRKRLQPTIHESLAEYDPSPLNSLIP